MSIQDLREVKDQLSTKKQDTEAVRELFDTLIQKAGGNTFSGFLAASFDRRDISQFLKIADWVDKAETPKPVEASGAVDASAQYVNSVQMDGIDLKGSFNFASVRPSLGNPTGRLYGDMASDRGMFGVTTPAPRPLEAGRSLSATQLGGAAALRGAMEAIHYRDIEKLLVGLIKPPTPIVNLSTGGTPTQPCDCDSCKNYREVQLNRQRGLPVDSCDCGVCVSARRAEERYKENASNFYGYDGLVNWNGVVNPAIAAIATQVDTSILESMKPLTFSYDTIADTAAEDDTPISAAADQDLVDMEAYAACDNVITDPIQTAEIAHFFTHRPSLQEDMSGLAFTSPNIAELLSEVMAGRDLWPYEIRSALDDLEAIEGQSRADLKADVAYLTKQVAELKADKERNKAIAEANTSELTKVSVDNASLAATNLRQRTELRSTNSSYAAALSEIAILRATQSTLNERNDNQAEHIAAQRAELTDVKQANSVLESAIRELQQSNAADKSTVAFLRGELYKVRGF